MARAGAKVLKLDIPSSCSEDCYRFLEEYVDNGGDHRAAWLEVYSESTVRQAAATVRKHWQTVEKIIKTRVGSHVPMALAGVVELAKNAKQESIKLKALQDILKRAGYDAPDKFEVTEKRADELDDDELKTELLQLLKKTKEIE